MIEIKESEPFLFNEHEYMVLSVEKVLWDGETGYPYEYQLFKREVGEQPPVWKRITTIWED